MWLRTHGCCHEDLAAFLHCIALLPPTTSTIHTRHGKVVGLPKPPRLMVDLQRERGGGGGGGGEGGERGGGEREGGGGGGGGERGCSLSLVEKTSLSLSLSLSPHLLTQLSGGGTH